MLTVERTGTTRCADLVSTLLRGARLPLRLARAIVDRPQPADAAAEAADAPQAAYFRRSLCAERAQLLAEICKRRDDIAKRTDPGSTSATHRLGSYVRRAEAQVRYLDRLIAGLDYRFGAPPVD
jgi:hypothetical protein